ncbi:MAG: hypothetical protein ACOC8E_00225 [Planctomycetota bacterium]
MCERWVVCVVVGVVLAGGTAAAWEIPLEVEEYRGAGGLRYVSGGVPLLPGQAMKTGELHLARKDDDGELVPVPAQYRVLARWWNRGPVPGSGDNSIRWVLVDFQTDIGAKDTQHFVLTNRALPAGKPPARLTVKETEDHITVTTGPAQFVVPRKTFAFLASAAVDANGDGRFSEGEELLDANRDCGTVLEDNFGVKYYSSESTRSVEVIERGPMRIRVRARGLHRARGGKGYSKGMYRYDHFIDFYAGSTTVFSDVIIGNNFPTSVGTPCFEDASLWLKLNGPATECSIAGHRGKPHEATLTDVPSVCLYQDSNGAKTWKKCQGYNTERRDYWRYPEGKTASFRGYKVWLRGADAKGAEADANGKQVANGDQATGTTVVETDRGGVAMHMRNFWQQFPKGVEVFADGRLRVALFPREYKVNHFLEDATAKGHEIALRFFAKEKPDAAKFAGAWDSKVLPRPAELEHIAACGALADTGPFTVPEHGLTKRPNNRTRAYDPRMLTTDGLYGNAYGWQVFGERWRSCGGHSSRGARQPMNEDNYLYRWFVTGVGGWLLNGDARSRHFRDVRAYRIEDVDPFGYEDWDDFRRHNRSEDWTRRPYPWDRDADYAAEAKKYSAGRYPRSTFWLPNPAHMVMDLCYDRYLLMGDQRSFENMRIIAAHGGYYAACRRPRVHRATGWSWRACFRYWELTGDKACGEMLDKCIANFKKMAEADEIKLPQRRRKQKDGTVKTSINWWFTYVFSRAAAMTALHTRDPDALFICKRMAETIAENKKHGGYAWRDFAELHGVLYHLTGDKKYKELGMGPKADERLRVVTAGMKLPACAQWLLTRPPEPLKE